MTSAVIINPRAGRGRGRGMALAEALKSERTSTSKVFVIEDFQTLPNFLADCAAAGVDTLFISSGDGTVQAIQTWIAESKAFRVLPRLCLLPHGTTNMTAADLGFRRTSLAEQVAFIHAPEPRTLKKRHTLRVANPRHGRPQHGMFFGTGAVAEATRYCQKVFNDKGVHGSFATFATLASATGKTLFSKANADDPHRFDRPYPLIVRSEGKILCDGSNTLMLATTLEKLILGSRPFWGGATAPLRITTVPYPVPNVLRWLVPTLYGSEARTPAPGTISAAANACEVTCPTDFVIDGEFHAPPENEALRLETGPCFEYITA